MKSVTKKLVRGLAVGMIITSRAAGGAKEMNMDKAIFPQKRGTTMKVRTTLAALLAATLFTAGSVLSVRAQWPATRTNPQRNQPSVPESTLRQISRSARPAPVTARRGALPTYTRTASGAKQLASNVVLLPARPGRPHRQIPLQLIGNQRINAQPIALQASIATDFVANLIPKRAAAMISGVAPEEVVPTGKVVVLGTQFDDVVSFNVTRVDNPRLYDHSYLNWPAHHSEEFGDYIEFTTPATLPPGRYWISIYNQNAYGSNPGYFTVKAPYPTKPYIVAMLDYLKLPGDCDTAAVFGGTGPGEFTFNFGTSTGNAGQEISRQEITFGENGNNGFLVNGSLELFPGQIELPLFSFPRERMGEGLMFSFVGQEFDESSASGAWSIAGGIIGAAAGGFFGGTSGLVSGYKLGSQAAASAAGQLGDSGNDSLGVHTNSFLREDDFGANLPGFPPPLAFDNNTGSSGRNFQIAYRVLNVDAPQVRRVAVRINSVDTSLVTFPPSANPYGVTYRPQFYVLARGFDGPIGANFPASRTMNLIPGDKKSAAARLDDAGYALFENANQHNIPFVYVELSLWYAMPGAVPVNRMVGKTHSRLFWPAELIRADQATVTYTTTDTVIAPPGAGFGGNYKVNYTITIDR